MSASKIQWTDDLLTGDKEIDTHHKAFFIKAQRLAVAAKLGKATEDLANSVRFLIKYAKHHFVAEQKRMTDLGYPYVETHTRAHEVFLADILELQKKVEDPASDKHAVAQQVADFAVNWFTGHLKIEDMPFIEFMQRLEAEKG